jgi:hypothetical protein
MSVRDYLLNSTRPIVVFTVGDKGGINKSGSSQTSVATLRQIMIDGVDASVIVTETDVQTSTMAQIKLATRHPIDLTAEDHVGHFLALRRDQLQHRSHAVVDTAAGQATQIGNILRAHVRGFLKEGIAVVVVLPLTASSVVQQQAVEFVEALPPSVAVVFVKNLIHGRVKADFLPWDKTEARARCLARGAVETAIHSVGIAIADNATSWQLSFPDIAAGRFAAAGEDEADAKEYFGDSRRLFIEDWLQRHTLDFAEAFQQAIANVSEK